MRQIALASDEYKRMYVQEKVQVYSEDRWADLAWVYDAAVLIWRGVVYACVLVPVVAFWAAISDMDYVRQIS